MAIIFTKEEKTKIDETLKKVTKDLRSIYEISQENEMKYPFSTVENDKNFNYTLVVKEKEAYMYLNCSSWYMQLDKKIGKKYHQSKIKDYTTAYEFLKQYETIRENLLKKAKRKNDDKEKSMKKIEQLNSKYTKDVIIEVNVPESVNQTELEVVKEYGQNIGHINIGPASIKILASPSIKIVAKTEKHKEKTKTQ